MKIYLTSIAYTTLGGTSNIEQQPRSTSQVNNPHHLWSCINTNNQNPTHNYNLSASSGGYSNFIQYPSSYTVMNSVTPNGYLPPVNYSAQYDRNITTQTSDISFSNFSHYPQNMGFQNPPTFNVSPSLMFSNSQELHYQGNASGQLSMPNVDSSGSARSKKRVRK